MRYAEWLTKRRQAVPRVLSLVRETEDALSEKDYAALDAIPQRYADLPFTPRVWQAYFGNAVAMLGVKRIDGLPYSTHPTRMALSAYWLSDKPDDVAVLCLVHDYLEESGGISPASYRAMRAAFSDEPWAASAAVLLSEPEIRYGSFGSQTEISLWKRIAYTLQVEDALARGVPRSFADAALADKLDNLHDLGYLERERKEAKRKRRISQRLAYFQFVWEHIGPHADPEFAEMLRQSLAFRVRDYDIGTEVGEELKTLMMLYRKGEWLLGKHIARFHEEIGLEWDV